VHLLLLLNWLDIIFFQETFVDASRARTFFSNLKPTWYSAAVSSVGK